MKIKYFNSEIIVEDRHLYATGLMSPVVYFYKGELYIDYKDLKKRYGDELIVNKHRETTLSYAFKYNTKDYDMKMWDNVEQIRLWKEIRIKEDGTLDVKYQENEFFSDPFSMDKVEEWWYKWRHILHNKENCVYDLTGGKDSRVMTSFYRDNEVDTKVFVRWTKKPFNDQPYDREISHKVIDRIGNDNLHFVRELDARTLLVEGHGTEPYRNQENNISYVLYLEQFHNAWKGRKLCPFVDDLLLKMDWWGHGEEMHDYLLRKYCRDLMDIDFHTIDKLYKTYKL